MYTAMAPINLLSIAPLVVNIHKCIFVRCNVALGTFGQSVIGRVLAAMATGAVINVTDPKEITITFAQPTILASKRVTISLLEIF